MRNRVLALVVVGMLATGYWMLSPGAAQTASQPASRSVVAVVNVPEVFRKSKELKGLNEMFKSQADALKKDVENRTKVLSDREAAVKKGFLPESKEYKERMKDLLTERINLRVSTEEKQKEMVLEHQRRTELFYDKMLKAIREIAQPDGYDLVLYKEDYDVKNAQSPEELLEMIRQKKVLYDSTRADITKKVIDKLDADFANAPK